MSRYCNLFKDIDIRASISLISKDFFASLDYSGPAVAVLSKTFLAVAVLFLFPTASRNRKTLSADEQLTVQEPVHGWPGRPCGIPVCGRAEPQVVPVCRPHLQVHKHGFTSFSWGRKALVCFVHIMAEIKGDTAKE